MPLCMRAKAIYRIETRLARSTKFSSSTAATKLAEQEHEQEQEQESQVSIVGDAKNLGLRNHALDRNVGTV